MEQLVKKLEEQISFMQQEISQMSEEIYTQQKEISRCEKCSLDKDIVICMICGYAGCGRQQNGCTLAHWKNSKHTLVAFLDSGSIWDYKFDQFVHRVNLTGDIFYENNIEEVYHQQV